ncbi:hypothetical protein [Pseudomonas citronellolis]|uniref:hypothetical protein n=1 Tax=Pseudomonas citronellolis TaxID=53408 RepID=UPI0011AB3B89|nr:hypothetical protein [Pseudomonas citronellolis]
MAQRTEKQLNAGQRRSLNAMREKLLEMAAVWDEVDQYHVTILTEAADKLRDVHDELLGISKGE